MKTDKQIQIDVADKLEFTPSIDATNITTGVHKGIVTLSGAVKTYAEKNLVEKAIQNIDGVKGIANELEVKLHEFWVRSDSEIALAATRALEWDVTIPKDKIKVIVEKGKLTLIGDLHWHYQKQQAEKDVSFIIGVKHVDNQIKIKPLSSIVTAPEVKQKITKEFERNAIIDANNITVEIEGSKVILKGTVRSWVEFSEASNTAWGIPGVTYVDNRLLVS